MGSGIYGIGVSALKVAQAGISVTSHNIANANTPGYTRQEILQSAMLPQNTGAGFFGQGADVTSVKRNYDEFLFAQVGEAQTKASNLNTQYALSQQVSNLLGDANGGLTPALQDFFSSINTVSNAPESVAARQTMIGSAQSLTNRLQTLDARLTEIRSGLNGQISNSTATINSYAKQIAALNDNIVRAQAQSGPNQTPNDLLDMRDQLLTQLSQEIRVSSVKQPDGSMDVFIGNGQSLVIGNQSSSLLAVSSTTDQTVLEVVYVNSKGISRIQQSALQGGNLGGYLGFRENVLDPAQNLLGRVAIGIADTFNQQHQQGIDLKGAIGGSFFTSGAPTATAATSNVGNSGLTATISSTSALTGRDYTLQFDGTSYSLFDNTDKVALQSFTAAQLATPQTVAGTGITLQLAAGSVADVAGDSFLIRPTAVGARDFKLSVTDPTKIAAANPIRANAPSTNLGSGVIAQPSVTGGVPVNVNLQQPISITFTSATTYTVTGTGAPVGPQAFTAGAAININGWSTQITGAPATGDKFTIGPNTNATTDGTNVLKLAQLQTTNTMVNGTASYQGAYGQLISQVGTQTRELSVTSTAQASMLAQVTKAQQSASGVNLDEEAANLLKYQQAYQAAAKAMAISQQMFDSLLQLGG
ncbi:MAG: flagellar hook-associated protein FlgK [Sideroxydans sp.]|nr:flagellar hook-associated protein FlgK [Sideroxydans sp.]